MYVSLHYFSTIKQILLISDTHSYCGGEILKHAKEVDEVWHAGDWGDISVSEKIAEHAKLIGVYGNIDDLNIRKTYPKELFFNCEGLNVYITHIGGYPGRYDKGIKEKLKNLQPDLYICGHSHICKIMRDKQLNLVHFNSGAIGQKGFHKKRTMMRFGIENGKLIDIKILEYERSTE
jgi:putative phosphoesterase